jgi:putative ABC transport system permease protein
MSSIVQNSIAEPRLESLLLGAFATVALFLAALGVYAIMNSLVQQREREIGIRMTLGATRGGILRMIVADASKIAAIGITVGLLLSFVLLKTLAAWLYGAKTQDVSVFAGACVALFVATMIACFIPALRASNKNPVEALRLE